MIYGAIIGDVCGSVYEHHNVKSKDITLLTELSRFTDDTVLTLAVCSILLNNTDPAEEFVRFYNKYPRAGFGGRFRDWAKTSGLEVNNSFGNGAIMRISPCAYISDNVDECLSKARSITEPTHDHAESYKAVTCFIHLLHDINHKKIELNFLEHYVKNFGYDISGLTLDKVRPDYKFDVTCQGTLPFAVLALKESTDFEDAIRNAISLGGDSDTLACITGALAEAYYQKIPDHLYKPVREKYLSTEMVRLVDEFTNQYS